MHGRINLLLQYCNRQHPSKLKQSWAINSLVKMNMMQVASYVISDWLSILVKTDTTCSCTLVVLKQTVKQ